MPALEEELRHAVAYRNEMAVELASFLLRLASDDGASYHPDYLMISAFGGDPDRLLANVQALTAVILNRAGMPWDAMAAQVECSKQALHRRHAARGERLFDEALSQFGERARTTDSDALVDALYAAEQIADEGDRVDMDTELRSLVPWESAAMISRLVTLPAPEYILTAGSRLAAALVSFRKIRRWWWNRGGLQTDQEVD